MQPGGVRPTPEPTRWVSGLRALAGPTLIVGTTLIVLHGFAFGGRLNTQHHDVLAQWLPNYCFLGRSLAAGHIPTWNPYVMGGVPFASDPQSGWAYLPAMALFSALPCGAAMDWFIVLQPILAGLGTYLFLRSEHVSRTAATCGGLVLAELMSGSKLAVTLPFAGTLAWTPLALAAVSRALGSPRWPGRLAWVGAAAIAWGQVAGAHLSHGLFLASGAIVALVAARLTADLRSGKRTPEMALVTVALLLVAFPLVNLAILWPRLDYVSRTSLSLGYGELQARSAEIAGHRIQPIHLGLAGSPLWPLGLARSPGSYAGAATLALAFGGWGVRRLRGLFTAFAVFGLATYLLSLQWVALRLRPLLGSSLLANQYLHSPTRLAIGTLLSVALLAAFGIEAWRGAPTTRRRLVLIVPGIAVWAVLAQLLAPGTSSEVIPLIGALAGGAILVAGTIRRRALVLLPVALAAELAVGGLLGQNPGQQDHSGDERLAGSRAFPPLQYPTLRVEDYLQRGSIVRALQARGAGRYVDLAPASRGGPRRPPFLQQRRDWPMPANQRAMFFHIEDVEGYNPAEPLRFWTFVRASQRIYIKYNWALIWHPTPLIRNVFQITDVAAATAKSLARLGASQAVPVARQGPVALYSLPGAPPRASVIHSWSVAGSADDALRKVLAQGFDPDAGAILESAPSVSGSTPAGHSPPSGPSFARYAWLSPSRAQMEVQTPGPAIILVRNTYDPNWHATVDAHPARVQVADYVVQAVAVPAGRHTIMLSYNDPSIGRGLLGSASMILALAGVALLLRPRRNRGGERKRGAEPDPADHGAIR